MLLQTNSYVVPKERRAEHQRLLRRFRQTLARLGCEHFEVYEQVGTNWTAGDSAGRYVQIMRFRDRRHQLTVQSAERADPGAQAVIAEFCNLINFPYQQQQGLFAVGFYQSALPVTVRREATRAEVAASDAVAAENEAEAEGPGEDSAEAEGSADEELADRQEAEAEGAEEEVELKAEAEGEVDEDEIVKAEEVQEGEDAEDLQTGAGTIAAEAEEARTAGPLHKPEVAAAVEKTDQALVVALDDTEPAEAQEREDEAVEAHSTGSAQAASTAPGHSPVAEAVVAAEGPLEDVVAGEDDGGAGPDAAPDVDELLFGSEEAEPLIADPALASPAEEGIGEPQVPTLEAESEFDEAGHAGAAEQVSEVGEQAGEPRWAADAEAAPELEEAPLEPQAESEDLQEEWDEVEPGEPVELSAEEGDFEIVYEQLPATADEAMEDEAGEPETDEEGGFDALLANEQLHEGFDAEDDLLHSAAHAAELHSHGEPRGRNGNSVGAARNGNEPHGQPTEARQGRMR